MNLYLVDTQIGSPDGAQIVLARNVAEAREVVGSRYPGSEIVNLSLVKVYPGLAAEAAIVGTISVRAAR